MTEKKRKLPEYIVMRNLALLQLFSGKSLRCKAVGLIRQSKEPTTYLVVSY